MTYSQKNFIYRFIKLFISMGFSFSFRNIITTGYKKVKKDKPAIFVANHQNTFMDGVLMVYTGGRSNPNILVRADIFKSKMAYNLLSAIKLMPIYRRRDGVNTVSENEQIFEQCYEIFDHKGVVALFPEGNHAFPRRLRAVQKGAARIAFQAEERKGFDLNLSLIPVGLHYENHTEKWHDVHIHYGEATLIKDYKSVYEESPQKAFKQTSDIIREGISSEMIDIKWGEEIELFEQIRALLKPEFKEQAKHNKSLVHTENNAIAKITSVLQENETEKAEIKEDVNILFSEYKKAGINTYYNVSKPNLFKLLYQSVILAILAPIFAVFKLITAIPEFIIESLVIKKVKDITWHLSLRFSIAAFLYPIFFALVWLILGLTIGALESSIIVFTFPLIGVIGLETNYIFRNVQNGWKLMKRPQLASRRKALAKRLLGML